MYFIMYSSTIFTYSNILTYEKFIRCTNLIIIYKRKLLFYLQIEIDRNTQKKNYNYTHNIFFTQ